VIRSRCRIVFGLFWLLGLLSLDTGAWSAEERSQLAASRPGFGLPSLDELKGCLKGPGTAEFLDRLYREAFNKHSTDEALRDIQRFEAQDEDLRRDCHPVVHAIGRETFRLKGNIHDAFSACDQTCHSGCYHGSVERFLRGEDIYSQTDKHPSQSELKQKAATACSSDAPTRLRFQCLHGLGHALMFFSRYQLKPSLEACDGLPDPWSQSSCYGGVFMENAFNATPEKRDVSATDYHYPCTAVAAKYRRECYLMQTSRMVEMGLSTERLFEECEKAGDYGTACALSIGRDLSNDARVGKIRPVAQKCELVAGSHRLACMRGVIYALVDNTWDGRYALPLCGAFSQEGDHRICIKETIAYLTAVFEKPAEEVANECVRYSVQSGYCNEIPAR
jgi:hypothetical protein